MATAVTGGIWLAARDPLSAVIAAASQARRRPLEARLAKFAYRPSPQHQRASAPDPPDVVLAAAGSKLLRQTAGAETPASLHAAGIAELIAGSPNAAEKLSDAVQADSERPEYWNDLAAALYTRARVEDDVHELCDALAAVDRALRLEPRRADALFNRALILDAMNLRPQAVAAWSAVLAADHGSDWAAEAQQRLHRLDGQNPADSIRPSFEKPSEDAAMQSLVASDPETARRVGETVLLANWGRARTSGQTERAQAWLANARVIGAALRARNGERLLADTVAAIDRCSSDACRKHLAEAHQRYDDARRAYGNRRVALSFDDFRAAVELFRREGSPMALVAEYYVASCLEDHSDDSVFALLQDLLARTPPSYLALRGQVIWTMSSSRARAGKTAEALELAERALVDVTRLGERANMNRIRDAVAALRSVLGDPAEAWRLRRMTFADYSNHRGDMQRALELAARTEAAEGHWGAASSLFALAVEEPLRINPRTHVSAMLWHALALQREGFVEEARHQLAAARRSAWGIADDGLRRTALDDLTFADAAVLVSDNPNRAAAILDRYIATAQSRDRTFLLAEAQLLRARAARAAGDRAAAEKSYRSAIDSADEVRHDAANRGAANAYFATATSAANELTDLLERQGRTADAFAVSERGRGRTFLERLAISRRTRLDPRTAEEIRTRLPARTAVVSFVSLPERLLVFTVDPHRGLTVAALPLGVAELQKKVRQLTNAIQREDDDRAYGLAEELYDELLRPVELSIAGADTLVLIPDATTELVPFGALRDRRTGRHLATQFALLRSPSASVFTSTVERRNEKPADIVIVADPDFDRQRFPRLARLAAAESEARSITRTYGSARVWIGEEATARRFLDSLSSARVVHIASHAVTSRSDPMQSMLLLASDVERSGTVTAREIAQTPCFAHVVVLAACRTAMPADTPSDIGTISLAFLAAGARNVVGTLWNVDDDHAAEFSRLFHAELVRGISPAEAMRRVQRQMLVTRPLRAWSGFVLIGAGT
ncbi:MAG TPA: CHAT domain-containing protein [Thermoanaerobaculia bacterium]